MLDVRLVEVVPLRRGGVARGCEYVRRGAVIVCGPLVEVVRDVVRGGVWPRVLEVHDDDLEGAQR